MHWKSWIVLTTLTSINARETSNSLPKFDNIRTIPPEHIGLYHTDSFERLSENIRKPLSSSSSFRQDNDKDAIHNSILEILSSYCIGMSDDCEIEAQKGILEMKDQFGKYKRVNELQFHYSHDDPDHSKYLHPSLKEYMEAIEYSIDSFNLQDIGDLVESLECIELELRNSEDMTDQEKYAGLAAVSVAIESSKLWFGVYENDKHPLRSLYQISKQKRNPQEMFGQDRFLQEVNVNINFNLFEVIAVDFLATLYSFGNPFVAIPASLFAFLYSIDPNNPTIINIVITPSPTRVPTRTPSKRPSPAPTIQPTSSNQPSGNPTSSSKPSSLPSTFPSAEPSLSMMPSFSPSTIPSSHPSLNPSTIPSGIPSKLPSTNPSYVPSLNPSMAPSTSSIPSLNPSKTPSTFPSLNPSSNPSTLPSDVPSTLPSVFPSEIPSLNPTITISPTSIPSRNPSKNPSTIPSINPSRSNIPSKNPSTIPSFQPS